MTELAKVYDPKSVEREVYDKWAKAASFHADPAAPGTKYCIVIPPPNVTAALHLGHALNNALQDVLVRWRRMQQYNTLWMPGTDHAGIATQTVVEKRILAEEGKRRTDFERTEFVGRIQTWKDEYEKRILHQLEQMGCSCDWQRTRFTMDETCARAVRATFFKLFSDGLIYRGKRLVNWDPATQTVLADDEVEHEEIKGHFWYLRYPLVEPVEIHGQRIEHVTVATTRPETMLGDTAVAMNPADPRAKFLVGKMVRLPLVGRLIPIVADNHVVMPNPESADDKARFSTGFLKVTPAHDPDDYQIGQRHNLPVINVMAPDGSISDKHGWTDWEQIKNPDVENVIGMDRFEARAAIVEWLRTEGLLEEVRDYTHQVGHSYRSHVPIEPYLSDQWYVAVKKPFDPGKRVAFEGIVREKYPDAKSIEFDDDMMHITVDGTRLRPHEAGPIVFTKLGDAHSRAIQFGKELIPGTDIPVNSLAGLALKPLLDGRVKFTPDRYANNYRAWLENLRDWPISRQLWWGHQIPVWSAKMSLAQWTQKSSQYLTVFGPVDDGCVHVIAENGETYYVEGPNTGSEGSKRLFDSVPRDEVVTWYVCLRDENSPVYRRRQEETAEHLQSKVEDEFETITAQAWADEMGLTRDSDVLDTWFSSALWPFSTLGWPEQTPELARYYPGDVLCTAREIITLWVSRMVMMGQYCQGDIPFHDVFIHAMIQDGEGRKMSKSLGNGIDPLDIIDSHGADAMRLTLVSMTTQTQDVRMPVESMTLPDGRQLNTSPKFDMGRNFCNKLWNASRFAMMNLVGYPTWTEIRPTEHLADAWILSRLNATIRDVTVALQEFRFNEVANTLYHFMWDDYCDWYLEIAKSRINAGQKAPKAIVAHCLDVILRLLHPVMPFITEAIWSNLNEAAPNRGPAAEPSEPLLVKAAWPMADASKLNPVAEAQFTVLQNIIREIRNVRTQHNVPPSKKADALILADGQSATILDQNLDLLKSLAALGEVNLQPSQATGQAVQPGQTPMAIPSDAAAISIGDVKVYLTGIVDRTAELARLQKQAATLANGIRAIQGKLSNEGFLAKAPADLVERERQRLETLQAELATVERSIEAMK